MDAAAIESYRKAGNIAARAREHGAGLIKPGVKLLDVATSVERFIVDHGGGPAFPCCISIDADAAHETPAVLDERVFREGQVVKLDTGVQVDGWIGDTAITVEVGTDRYAALKRATQDALDAALKVVRPGVDIRDVSAAIEGAIRGHGFQPIVNLTGHSVDQYHQHAGVSIPNVASTARGRLEHGMAVAIEPFSTDGVGKIKDSAGGHIYHYMGPRPVRDPTARKALEFIQQKHDKLPFAERWIAEAIPADRVTYTMRLLERAGAVKQYSILREVGGGQVTQFEHTILVLDEGCVVTTKA
jgi:methionyl aminopeptidase